ncbi:MAG: DUF3034 family protein [Candidatus Brocadiia bacterium]|jgi:hypothetical protein|nr:MAG: DUF3034 family protein [Candidatus Brocadiia bacterium]
MKKPSRTKELKVVLFVIAFLSGTTVFAGPPLPTHNVEGNSGVFITSTAYLANPAEEGAVFGQPSTSGTFVWMDNGGKDFESIAVTENIWGNVELGYALERIGLGDWPDAVSKATLGSVHVDNHVFMHNFNTRLMVIEEGGHDLAWMPAVTLGAHFKWNDGLDDIDYQTNGLCGALGANHDSGTEVTAVATKTITDWLPRPIIVSAGLRNGDGIHTGLLGFAGERRTTFEGSFIYFLTDKLLLASEYRQKSDLLDQCTIGGEHLIKAENDWWDIALAYVVNDRLTIAGGYADFGNVLNHRENNSWAIQVKYEF